jgi:hypothetical protein
VRLADAWAQRTHRIALRSETPPAPATQTLIEALTHRDLRANP